MKSKEPSGRRSYRQGRTKIYLQPVEDVLAVRYANSKEEVRKTLSSLGKVKEVEPQKLFVVQLPKAGRRNRRTRPFGKSIAYLETSARHPAVYGR
jgi:hypothetical protein